MDFTYPVEAEAFRVELRQWLDANLTDRHRGLTTDLSADPEWLDRMREWNRELAEAGYAAIAWPAEYGGRGAGLWEQVVWAEEMHRAAAPPPLNPIGIANIAPAILEFGTEEQKRRHLPALLTGEVIWCQGFSEPDAGSDLASLGTTARREGDHYVVTGQKVWTTFGHIADRCELLVRTDPGAGRHAGFSMLLVDLASAGVEVRPLVTITGAAEFAELFLTEVRVPAADLLGVDGGGWAVAMATLSYERAGVANLHLGLAGKLSALVTAASEARRGGGVAADDPALRRRIARAHLRATFLGHLATRAVAASALGRPPGAASSVAKLVWSELEQEIARIGSDVAGPEGWAGPAGRSRLAARALSIAGGTTQVNRNIVARRLLGMPRA